MHANYIKIRSISLMHKTRYSKVEGKDGGIAKICRSCVCELTDFLLFSSLLLEYDYKRKTEEEETLWNVAFIEDFYEKMMLLWHFRLFLLFLVYACMCLQRENIMSILPLPVWESIPYRKVNGKSEWPIAIVLINWLTIEKGQLFSAL